MGLAADAVLLRGARSALLVFLGVLVSPRPFRPSQKQLTQDDDADEVEIAVDNTAFMDEFFSEVGALERLRGEPPVTGEDVDF